VKLLFLGTGAATPSLTRNPPATALQLEQRSEWWLFDCGEGTQHRVLQTSLSLPRLRRVFLTHLHGDHCFGLPGVLSSRGLQGGGEADVYGPPGVKEFVHAVLHIGSMHLNYPCGLHEIEGGPVFEDDEYAVNAVPVAHAKDILSLAYIIEEKPRPGRFKVEAAQALDIPAGPLFGRLKRGEKIEWDGRVVDGAALVEPPRRGRKLVYVGDTSNASPVLEPGRGADLLVHEATYSACEDAEKAVDYGHATAADAGRLAKRMGARQLVLMHFSPRYDQQEPPAVTVADLVREAEAEFEPGKVIAAADLMQVAIPRPKD
jgi:ribonuclease Z